MMEPQDYDYLVRFPRSFRLCDIFTFASSKGFLIKYLKTDPTRRQHPRMYEAVPAEADRGEPAETREFDRGEPR